MKGIAQSFWNGSPAIPLQSGLVFTKINNNHNTEMKDWPYIDRVWLKTPIENFKKIIIYIKVKEFFLMLCFNGFITSLTTVTILLSIYLG